MKLTSIAICVLVVCMTVQAASRPNVLFIAIDDLNDWVGCLGGHPDAKTPHIDRLASQGVLFTNAHCAGPVCNPSRTALLTGLRPSSTGVYGNGDKWRTYPATKHAVTLPAYFRDNGYRSYGNGKIFHGQDRRSWSDWGKGPDYNVAKGGRTHKKNVGPIKWGIMEAGDESMKDYQNARWVADELQKQHDKPFFLACGIFRPHLPFYAPKKYFDLYPLDKITMPVCQPGDMDDIPEAGRKIGDSGTHAEMLKAGEKAWREAVQAYLACVSFADACVGVVMEGLAQSPHRDNTIVVLWADHGWHLGEKLHWRKMTLWEEATRNILYMSVPGLTQANQRCDAPVNLLDIYPTLVDIAGLPPKAGLEGDSLRPLLKNVAAPWERPSITTYHYKNHSVRSRDWRYVQYRDGSEELYDHRQDPHEFKNLANDPRFAEIKAEHIKWLPKINVPEGG